ncbi:hypothetical protein BDK92_7222 [Micromonospora pisi]|uniref:Uncharacterized protein n=1 Tax=Micromonospora pisi TaxID=589240 RepID=A0A495JWW0_9ACTN|nr:hypothetical protein [Micromonospora pisi]RKR92744.1 hypothetical protein BDK92_7222 [Micromonospora pisi]
MTDEDGAGLTKVTYNLTPGALDARDELVAGWRVTRTRAVDRALRVAAMVHRIAPDGHMRVMRDDGSVADVYFV